MILLSFESASWIHIASVKGTSSIGRVGRFLTLELQLSHICDARRHAVSAAVTFMEQSNQVALTA